MANNTTIMTNPAKKALRTILRSTLTRAEQGVVTNIEVIAVLKHLIDAVKEA